MITFPPLFHPLEQGLVRKVLVLAAQSGQEVYLVGGYLRDALSGRLSRENPPHDFDWSVRGGAIKLAQFVSSQIGGHFVLLDETNDTARVVLSQGVILDFAGCVGDNIQTDILRRDFTINSLAWNPCYPDLVLDLVDGLADLQVGVVRAVSAKTFADDPLRLLRAYRLSAQLGFSIDQTTAKSMEAHCQELLEVAPERINYELFAILETPAAGQILRAMADRGILEQIFPELIATRSIPPNAYHHLGLFDHSLATLTQVESLLGDCPPWVTAKLNEELSQAVSRLAATKAACLLHDIGKPATWVVTAEGKHTFLGHDRLGAQMCEPLAKRLRWSRPLERLITKLIAWHLRPAALFHQGSPSPKAIQRFYRTIGNEVPELILLALADFGATCGIGLQQGRDLLKKNLYQLLSGYLDFLRKEEKAVNFLNGHEIMRLLDIPAGPSVGVLLAELKEAQALSEVCNRQQAEDFVKQLYKEKYDK